MVVRRQLLRLRSELRLYRRPGVLLLGLAFALVVLALLLISQDYVRGQADPANFTGVSSCAEMIDVGPASQKECAQVQASQRESNRYLARLATRVGPPGASAHEATGISAFVLGHASTAGGLTLIAAIAALVLGGEAEVGVGLQRDTAALRPSAWFVRAVALVCVWALLTSLAIVLALVASRLAGIGQTWRGGPDYRSSGAFLARRVGGGLAVAVLASTILTGVRSRANSRARMFVSGLALVVFVTMALGSGCAMVPPTNALWAAQQFGSLQMSYIDRLPFAFELRSSDRFTGALTVGLPAACLLWSACWPRLRRR